MHEYEAILESLNDLYLQSVEGEKSADVIWEEVEGALISLMYEEGGIEYSEELTQSVRMVMVHGFMKCKILEEPKP